MCIIFVTEPNIFGKTLTVNPSTESLYQIRGFFHMSKNTYIDQQLNKHPKKHTMFLQ